MNALDYPRPVGAALLLVLGLAFWQSVSRDPASTGSIVALIVLAVASRLSLGNLVALFLATALIAMLNFDFHSDQKLEAVYMPILGMVSVVYLLIMIVVLAPGLARSRASHGVYPGPHSDSDGGGGGGGGGDGGGGA